MSNYELKRFFIMSNYEFLTKLKSVLYLHDLIHYDDGTFSVVVDDVEGWNSTIITFDKDGNFLWET